MIKDRIKIIGMSVILAVMLLSLISPSIAHAQQKETVLKVGIPGEIDNFNPLIGLFGAAGYIRGLLFDTLLIMPSNRSYCPWLAQSWTVNEKNLTITFKLRPNLKWHDGQPLTAKDVEFTFNLIINSKYTPKLDRWNLHNYIAYVKAIDNRTVVFKLKEPFAPILWYIGLLIPVLPEHIWSKVDPTTFKNTEHPIGSGPFKFVKYTPGVSVELEAFDDYFAGRPKIDKLIIGLYKSTDSVLLDLQAGAIDAIAGMTVAPELVPTLLKDPHIRVVIRPDLGYIRFMGFNLDKYPFNVREFREAVAYAIDKDYIVKTVMLGYADPAADGWVQPIQGIWYNKAIGYRKQNLTKAMQILDSIGFIDRDGDGIRETPNGTKLEFTLLTLAGRTEFERTAEIIANWLNQIGIKVKVEAYSLGTVDHKEGVGDFDMGLMGVGGLTAEIDYYLYPRFHSSGAPPIGKYAPRNWFRYRNPEVDKLLEEQRTELNLTKRIQIVYKIQEIIAHDIPVVTLYVKRYVTAYRTDRFVNWNEKEGPASKLSLLQVKPRGPATVTTTKTATSVTTSVVTTSKVYTTVVKTTISGTPTTVVKTMTSATTYTTTVPVTYTKKTGISTAAAIGIAIIIAIIAAAIAYWAAKRG